LRFFLALIVFVVLILPHDSHSGVRFADVGFEVSGMVGAVSPTDFNQLFAERDADAVNHVYGFGAAALLPLGAGFRASVGSGYFRGESGEGTVYLYAGPAPLPSGVPTPVDFTVESVPLTGTVDFVLKNRFAAVTLGTTLEMYFLTVTRRIHEQPALEFNGDERSTNATIPGLSVTVGVEWAVNPRTYLGFRGGYRFAEGDMSFPDGPDGDRPFDLSGGFVTVLFRVHPWLRASVD
jgi:hypothetical protein